MSADRAQNRAALKAACRQAAIATSIVSGLVAACAGVLLLANYYRMRTPGPLDDPRLRQLRTEIHRQGPPKADPEKFRNLDLELRREYFRRKRFAVDGGYLLAGAFALCVGAGLLAAPLGKEIDPPVGAVDFPRSQRQLAAWGRLAVAAVAVVLISGTIISAVRYEAILTDKLALGDAAPPPAIAPLYWPAAEQVSANWPRFRGPGGAGVSAYDNVPDSWDGASGRGILWEAFVPFPGQNSPVLWGDRVFLTGADSDGREVYCYSADSGELLWRKAPRIISRSADATPEVSDETGYAAPTAAADGKRVYALFANGHLVAFDFAGRQVWGRDLGVPKSMYGFATSLVMHRHLLLVQFDQGYEDDDLSALLAIDGASGKTVWRVNRLVSDSWATPIVAATPTGDQLITLAKPWVIAYDPATGKEIWKAKCLSGDVAPSPIYAGGLVFATAPDVTVYAIRTDGQGDVTETHIAWEADDGVPDITSPVSDGRRLWLLTTQGLLTCYDAQSGRKLYEHQFDGMFQSSPSLAGGRVYIMDNAGRMHILAAGEQFKLLGSAELGEKSNCSPAFADGRIYIRGEDNLYCIAAEEE